jgi:hypothetical protein
MRQPSNLYHEFHTDENNPPVIIKSDNCCDLCQLYRDPSDGRMSCKILLRSFEQEFERTVQSLKQDITGLEGYAYGDSAYYSWMDLMALLKHQRRFTALYGCGLFVKRSEL